MTPERVRDEYPGVDVSVAAARSASRLALGKARGDLGEVFEPGRASVRYRSSHRRAALSYFGEPRSPYRWTSCSAS
jgi:hypothetical protein